MVKLVDCFGDVEGEILEGVGCDDNGRGDEVGGGVNGVNVGVNGSVVDEFVMGLWKGGGVF